MDHKLY